MNLPKFVDVHPAHNPTGYKVTNEEPEIHRRLLLKRKFKRAAGISSGGEIPLYVLLPISEEVVAVDHSYLALAVTFLKATILATLGPKDFKTLFLEKSYTDFKPIAEKAMKSLPEPLDKHIILRTNQVGSIGQQDFKEWRRELHYTPLVYLTRALRNLSNLTLIHGDLSDLKDYGTFDCLYISNALEHQGRNLKAPRTEDFESVVTPDGMMLLTRASSYTAPPAYKGWNHTKMIDGFRTSWNHFLLTKEPAAQSLGAGV